MTFNDIRYSAEGFFVKAVNVSPRVVHQNGDFFKGAEIDVAVLQ